MQARQMVTHGHFLLNGKKHNVPSAFVVVGDKISIKDALKASPLYAQNTADIKGKLPSWIKVDASSHTIEVLSLPQFGEIGMVADLLKVIEFYARA